MVTKVNISILLDIYIYEGNALPSPLCIKLLQMKAYDKYFDKNNKSMNILVYDKKILKKYNDTQDKTKTFFGKKLIVNQNIMINTLKLK